MCEAEDRSVLSSLTEETPELLRLLFTDQPMFRCFFEEAVIQFHSVAKYSE